MNYVIFTSGGNDSVALTQFAADRGLKDVYVVYTNTGWAADWWPDRINRVAEWVESLGFTFVEIRSEGMEALTRRKKAFPRGGGGKFQFCTKELKEKPAIEWLDKHDPEKEATCMVGIRREESANRRTFPEWTYESEKHGNRELWAPLVTFNTERRNDLLQKTPFDPLPYRSKECFPCVNAGKRELKLLPSERVDLIETLEIDMGVNSKGNERVMFSPARHGGAVGIREVVNEAQRGMDDMLDSAMCDSGWCGD